MNYSEIILFYKKLRMADEDYATSMEAVEKWSKEANIDTMSETVSTVSCYINDPVLWCTSTSAPIYNPTYRVYKTFSPSYIKDVQFFEKVVKMEFTDGTVTVAKLQEGDDYSKETGMMICIMEYIYGNKQYNNTFRHWIKKDENRKKARQEAEARQSEAKEIAERQAARKARRKAARKEKAKQEAIEIQKEAYKQAMDEYAETINQALILEALEETDGGTVEETDGGTVEKTDGGTE